MGRADNSDDKFRIETNGFEVFPGMGNRIPTEAGTQLLRGCLQ